MNKKTCKDCLHCTVDDEDVLCVDMPWHYPFGGSDTTTLDKDACEYFIERKTTVFDKITANEEVLAEKLVYSSYTKKKLPLYNMKKWLIGYKTVLHQVWRSSITDETYSKKSEALAATMKELKKEER